MNRYRNAPNYRGTASKASATTLCQKCLKRDIFECKASAQERPYVSRPSRTKQLANPKLRPELTKDIPEDFTAPKTSATAATAENQRGRRSNRERHSLSRSPSPTSSISSISTISTTRSRSVTPASKRRGRSAEHRHSVASRSGSSESESDSEAIKSSRYQRKSPPEDFDESGARSTSRRDAHRYRQRSRDSPRGETGSGRGKSPVKSPKAAGTRARPNERGRSLSPYSKRLALTQAMSSGGRI